MAMEADPAEDTWWFICSVCRRAYAETELSAAREHKWTEHGSKGTADILILSQRYDLPPSVKIARCSASGFSAGAADLQQQRVVDKAVAAETIQISANDGPPPLRSTRSNACGFGGVKKTHTQTPVSKPKQATKNNTAESSTCNICSTQFPTLDRLKKHISLIHAPNPIQAIEVNSVIALNIKAEPLTSLEPLNREEDTSEQLNSPSNSNAGNQSGVDSDADPLNCDEDFHVRNSDENSTSTDDFQSEVEPDSDWEDKTRNCGQAKTEKHTKVQQYKCPLCPEVCQLKRDLLAHENAAHTSAQDRTCSTCGKLYRSRERLAIHQSESHGRPRNHLCSSCGMSFHTQWVLTQHSKIHGQESKHACDVCGRTFTTLNLLDKHKLTHNPAQIQCQICGLVLKTEKTLKKHHIRKHTQARPFKCSKCGLAFKLKEFRRRHEKNMHGESGPFLCKVCPMVFKSEKNLTAHVRNRHNTKVLHICRVCGQELPNRLTLVRHEVKEHDFHRSGTKRECKQCNKIFLMKSAYENHVASHLNEKGFVCAVCGKGFKVKSNLDQHSVTHLSYEDYKHECDICGKKFGLAHHVRQHKGKYHRGVDVRGGEVTGPAH